MGGLSIVRGIIGGVAGAAGDPQTQAHMDQLNQQAQQQKIQEQRAKIAPLALNVKNLKQGIENSYNAFQQQNPGVTFDQWKTGPGAHEFNRFADLTQYNVHSMREILHPDWTPGPMEWLKTHTTDRAHITNAAGREAGRKNDAAWDKYNEGQIAQSQVGSVQPGFDSKSMAAQSLESQKAKAAQDLEKMRLEGGLKLEGEKAKYGMDLEKAKSETQEKIAGQRVSEQERRDDERMKMFSESQARLERQHDRSQANQGTWSVVEDETGKPTLFNSKTGEQKDAPAGMHKSGYFAKQIAPLEAADLNIKQYVDNGVFTGPDDLALQHEFFTATQPSTGFRMTKVQQDILADSQNWINSIKGKIHHATTGTWFSDEQRRQIANAAQQAIAAKKKSLSAGGPQKEQLQNMRGGGNSNVIVVSPEDMNQ